MPQELGEIVRSLRRRRGWNQTRLARESRVGFSTIAKIEQGRGKVQSYTANRLFEAFRDQQPGLRRSQAVAFCEAAGLDRGMADDPRVKPDAGNLMEIAEPLVGERMEQLVDRLGRAVVLSGSPHAAADLLEMLIGTAEQWLGKYFPAQHGEQEPARGGGEQVVASYTHPVVKHDGYTEQVRVDYIRTPDREPPEEKAPESRRHAS